MGVSMMDQALRLYHQQAVEVWENFCRLHRDLFERTCDEYQALLSGELESLETLVALKEAIMAEINDWETRRANLIHEMNGSGHLRHKIKNISDLLSALQRPESQLPIPALHNLNALLIDIITRTQEQNKRNQLFLNRALLNIRELKDGFTGKRTYTTYGSDGMTRSGGR